jgi:glycosyltransferase involved in cell wall biosynthesis
MPQREPRRATPDLVSVIVPTYNAAETLGAQLTALADQDYAHPFEVVVVDNRSTDGSAAIAESFAGRLKLSVVPAQEHQSVAHARNVGIRAASGGLVLICDADDVVEPSWIRRLVAAARCFDLAAGDTVASIAELEALDGNREHWQRSARPLQTPHWWTFDFAVGCNLAIWKDTFAVVGEFDQTIRYAEDADYSLRAQQAGLDVGFCEAAVYYRPRPGFRDTLRQQYRYGQSVVALYVKHRSRGMVRRPSATVLRRWAYWLVRTPLAIRDETVRVRWARNVGKSTGYLVGSYRSRVWYP